MNAETGMQFLGWRLGDFHFGVDVRRCREVNRATAVTPVPQAPDSIVGVANLRGDVVTVLNLPAILGFAGRAEFREVHALIRLNERRGLVALHADEILDVFQTGESLPMQPVPEHFSDVQARLLGGAVRLGEHLVLLLQPQALFEMGVPAGVGT